jgi:hypothetical protein
MTRKEGSASNGLIGGAMLALIGQPACGKMVGSSNRILALRWLTGRPPFIIVIECSTAFQKWCNEYTCCTSNTKAS